MASEKLNDLILLRLFASNKPFTPLSDIQKDVKSILPKTWSDAEIKKNISTSLDMLENSGAISRNKNKSSAITDKGKAQVFKLLNIDQLPSDMKWKTIKSLYLPALAMNMNLKSADELQAAKKADGFRIAALKYLFDLPVGSKTTLLKTVDLLIAKFLKPTKSGIDALRTAAIRNWIESESPPDEIKTNLEEIQEEFKPEFDPQKFVDDVMATAKTCKTGWFGDNKVFISHVWRKFKTDYPEYNLDEAEFKAKLVELVRDKLSRADLVSVMNPQDVAESEACYLNATFHFIRVERRSP